MKTKILTLEQLTARAAQIRAAGEQLCLTNGCFDLLHVGHVRYLEAARALGDYLAVAVNGDESVRALKGEGRPINCAADRAEVLAALRCVDFVTIFPSLRVTRVIEVLRPNVYAKGGDYSLDTLDPEESAALKKIGTRVEILPLAVGKSTSRILENLRRSGNA